MIKTKFDERFWFWRRCAKDWTLNHIARWCIRHSYSNSTLYYELCKKMDANEIKVYTRQVLEAKEKGVL